MDILILVLGFILLSNVNTLDLQPIDTGNVVFSPANESNKTNAQLKPAVNAVNVSQSEYLKNESKSGDLPLVAKNTSTYEKVPNLLATLEIAKKILFDRDSIGIQLIKEPKNMTFVNESRASTSTEITEDITASSHAESSKKENVKTATKNTESSFLSESLSNGNSTKVIDKNIVNIVLEPFHNGSSKINREESSLIVASSDTTCDTNPSFCKSSQECRHGNGCTYMLIFVSSLYFYHSVGAFE